MDTLNQENSIILLSKQEPVYASALHDGDTGDAWTERWSEPVRAKDAIAKLGMRGKKRNAKGGLCVEISVTEKP